MTAFVFKSRGNTHLEQTLHSGFLRNLAAFVICGLRLSPWPFASGVGHQKKSKYPAADNEKK